MLIHLMPTFYNPYSNVTVSLKSLVIIAGDDNFEYQIPIEELTLKKPFPNKAYFVACRKRKNKAFLGLYAHIDKYDLKEFTVYEEWETILDDKSEYTHFHYIKFNLLDNNFGTVSQDILCWDKYKTEIHKDWIPLNCTPKMEFDTDILRRGVRWDNDIKDGYYFNGIIKQRVEQYNVPTIPHEHLFTLNSDRMPDINIDGFNLTIDGGY